jgi:hypothetical protein
MKSEDVPPEIMKIAKEKVPDVTITGAYKEGPNYELRGKDKKGKLHEIDITPEDKSSRIEILRAHATRALPRRWSRWSCLFPPRQ